MGKFTGAVQFRGKLKDVVGYKVTNAKISGTIGLRAHVETIANPKTTPQATQRMRMKPAINFYQGLASLLDHSWQGVKYGARSRAKFMQLALSPTLQGIPYVDKGETRFIPGAYPVSTGQVGVNTQNISFATTAVDAVGARWDADIDLADFDAPTIETWGVYSQSIIEAYAGLQDGDEITGVCVFYENGFYQVMHRYFVLDVSSLATVADVIAGTKFMIGTDGELVFDPKWSENGGWTNKFSTAVAAAIIVSRHPSKNSTTWLRTSSTMVVSDALRGQWMSEQRLVAARATYQNSTVNLTSDWLLNQSENLVNAGGLNPGTSYALSTKVVSIGGIQRPMACLSIDGAAERPIIETYMGNHYYGTLSGSVVSFVAGNLFTGEIGDTPYYDAAAVKAADRSHTYNLIADSDDPVIEPAQP